MIVVHHFYNQEMDSHPLRQLPGVNEILSELQDVVAIEGHRRVVSEVRRVLEQTRENYLPDVPVPSVHELVRCVRTQFENWSDLRVKKAVINATGVVIHTNLGRSVLSSAAQQAMLSAATGYTALEFDLSSGERGRRGGECEHHLTELTGAEAALVVNNCAAATVLMLSSIASGKEVVVSRGELVEIGGGFRIPDIMATSRARLVEVGTTNRTRRTDYESALRTHDDVAAIMHIHPSNFQVIGFTESVTIQDLSDLAQIANQSRHSSESIAVLDDVGSGALVDTSSFGLSHEPLPQESIAAGADIVTFSGDKLLGGPQAGIMIGRRELIEKCRTHPLARAFRIDKFSLAALSATLLHYLRGEATREVPTLRMLSLSSREIRTRSLACVRSIEPWLHDQAISADIIEGHSTVGGGSLPGQLLPTALIALNTKYPVELLRKLRQSSIPVIGRIQDNRVLLDLRTVLDDAALVSSINSVSTT